MSRNNWPIVWMIWDGAPYWAIRKLIMEGNLPFLEQVKNNGIFAATYPPNLNCQTPPSLANLFTGVSMEKHGISGFNVPSGDMSTLVTKKYNGFQKELLNARTIWDYAGEQGKECILVSIPWVDYNTNSSGCKFALDGYLKNYSRRGAILIKDIIKGDNEKGLIRLGSYIFSVRIMEESVEVCLQGSTKKLILNEFEHDWRKSFIYLNSGIGVYMWIKRRESDNELILIYSGIWKTQILPQEKEDEVVLSIGPFNGESHGSLYRNEVFGKRIVDGGEGSAEKILLWSIKQVAEYYTRACLNAIETNTSADLYVFYLPYTDDIGHELMGWCDPKSKVYKQNLAPQIWEYVREVYQAADQCLGNVQKCLGRQCSVIISSDHGMAGIESYVHINEVLNKEGLLRFDCEGNIDLKHTKILYHPAENGSLWINDSMRPEGIVCSVDRSKILNHTTSILKRMKDQITGQYVIKDVQVLPHTKGMGDIFLVPSDGYELSGKLSHSGEVIVKSSKSAVHSTNPKRTSLKGILCINGDEINANKSIGIIDNRDVFPLICKLLRIIVPKNIQGKVPKGIFKNL